MNQLLTVNTSLFFEYAKSSSWIWCDHLSDQSGRSELSELSEKHGFLHEWLVTNDAGEDYE